MSLLNRIAQRIKRDSIRWLYNRSARQVLQTAPLRAGTSSFVLLSMVQKQDVLSYLVAVKSFAGFTAPHRVVVVCDPSMERCDRELLQFHVPHIELRSAEEFVHPSIPRGGCWERLYAITEYSSTDYVVQLDADTITRQGVPEILAAIASGSGFVLGDEIGQTLLTLDACAARASAFLGMTPHVQTSAESAMASIGLPERSMYVRGCAGFTGFPVNPLMRVALIDFSERMTKKLGDRWSKWGTEQVASNYLVANAPGTSVLPFPKYGTPDRSNETTAFLHFIGPMRFVNRRYERVSKEVIRALKA